MKKLKKQLTELYAKWRTLALLCGSGELSHDEVEALFPLAESYSRAVNAKRAQLWTVTANVADDVTIDALLKGGQ